ncbi:MAG: hypothetical protein P1V34_18250 [Alphaproteobacteria bacterium]|nr:hypothetical protein [Alphaproteobacteria bacterium]
MGVLEIQLSENLTDRRNDSRLTTVLPVLELDGRYCRLVDFSDFGFRANVPRDYRVIGKTGQAVLHLNAAGHSVHKEVEFEVVHVNCTEIGVRYQTLKTETENSGTLF